MKIDIFPHILPIKFMEAFHKEEGLGHLKHLHQVIPTLSDLDSRFKIMQEDFFA